MEFVYVVKRRDLFDMRAPHGLELLSASAMEDCLARIRERGFFVERRWAEGDAGLKQIIPYGVVVRGGEVFLMRRLSAGGEKRLHGKRSIGVGGHVNPVDGGTAESVLDAALRREIGEELFVEGGWDARAVGVLNDESTDVGSVHFGLVHTVRVAGGVRVRETDALEGGFLPSDDLGRLSAAERGSFETWSALLVDRLDELLPAAPATV